MLLFLLPAKRNGNYFVLQLQINVRLFFCWPNVSLLSELSNRITHGTFIWKCLHTRIAGWGHVTISKRFSSTLLHTHDMHLNFNIKSNKHPHENCIAFLCGSISFSCLLFIFRPFQTISNNICVFVMRSDKIGSTTLAWRWLFFIHNATCFSWLRHNSFRFFLFGCCCFLRYVSYCYGNVENVIISCSKDLVSLNETCFQFAVAPYGI